MLLKWFVRLCLERVPAALFACGCIGVYLGKRTMWAHSLRSSFLCLPWLLCSFLLTLYSIAAGEGGLVTAAFFTARWSSTGPSTGFSWRPATLFALGSTLQLFDDRPCALCLHIPTGPQTRGARALPRMHASLHAHDIALCAAL